LSLTQTEILPYKKNAPWTDEFLHYAYTISNKDKNFIALLACENGAITHERKHGLSYWRNGKEYWDFGFCGISNYYHPQIVNNPKFFTDWKWQMEQCYNLFRGGTRFYGLDRRESCEHIIEYK